MRTGGCTVQQALSPDAAAVVKQAVALAKRRGHVQVSPLHVANTMLSSSTGLFRVACLQSHSHPLQCKALELCFNVALNRLPASSSSPMLGPHSQYPSISNALVAAFKRAQAHQRRGSIESQQQPVLAVKIELEQLIISILDDPSVSRVMREAGFSSTQVKTNVEKTVSLELCSRSSSPAPSENNKLSNENSRLSALQPTSQGEKKLSKSIDHKPELVIRNEDVNIIIENLQGSRKSTSLVIVGECISNIESIVKGLMNRVDKGDVPENMKQVKFITIPPLYTFCNLHREEVEQKIGELTCLVRSLVSKGVVLYLGDLKWISDYRVELEQEKSYYCSVEHMIMELGKLVCGIGEMGRFWLMGIATFQTYMRCRSGYHSLENVWGLHPVTIPANSLGLSLIPDHRTDEQVEDRRAEKGLHSNNDQLKLSCCADCTAKFEDEARNLESTDYSNVASLSSLPPWLKDESRRLSSNNQNDSIRKLCNKWNLFCSTASHNRPERLSSNQNLIPSPSSSISFFSLNQHNPNFQENHSIPTSKENHHWLCSSSNPNSNSTPNSASSSDIMEMQEYIQKFKEFSAENLNTLCNALEERVPWQKEIIPEVATTILQCRSRMRKRKQGVQSSSDIKEETWMLFLGHDALAKEKISRELAKLVFGSYSKFITIGLNNFVSSEDCRNKRAREELSCSNRYIDKFAEAMSQNPHRVFLVEDLEQMDYRAQMELKKAIERGRIGNSNGEEVSFCDAVVVLSCESFGSGRSRDGSPSCKQKTNGIVEDHETTGSRYVSLDLNISCDDYVVDHDRYEEGLEILESVDRVVVFNMHEVGMEQH